MKDSRLPTTQGCANKIKNLSLQQGANAAFSMAAIYHRRDCIIYLYIMHTKSGGEIVLETLVLNKDVETALKPEYHYARW